MANKKRSIEIVGVITARWTSVARMASC